MMDGFASGAASGYAHAGSTDVGEHRRGGARHRGRRPRETACAARRSWRPGEYEVILEEYAVAGLLEYRQLHRLQRARPRGGPLVHGPRQAADGGERQHLGRRERIRAACRSPIDFEGVARTPRRPHPGRRGAGRSCTTRPPASRAGTGSTGHALPAPNLLGPMALNLFMAPGSTPRDELIDGVEARDVGDPLPLHQPGSPQEGDPDRA